MAGLMGGSGSGGNSQQAMNNPSTSQQFNSPRAPTLLDAIVRHVFEEDLRRHSFDNVWSELPDYGSIQTLLRLSLENKVQEQQHSNIVAPWSTDGLLGPSRVQFDVDSSVGSFMINNDRLGLNSQDNFSTIHANTCVYKGKWQYELMLGTKGVMQVGWATKTCLFSQEKGVGDTADSYAYDGNRQRKWNVATYKYGEMWQCGDIISCTMDLDEGTVHFFRNGRDLGAAFTNVKTGPGVAYFPAVSLALGENLIINFGATPFRYPQHGYCPLEAPPTTELLRAHSSFTWLHKLINVTINWNHYNDLVGLEAGGHNRRESSLLLVAQHISTHLGPLLAMPYVVEACLVPTLYHVVGINDDNDDSIASLNTTQAHVLFNFLMGSLEDHELLKCLENLIICLLTGHKQASESIKFRGQKRNLRLLYVLLTHTRLRKYCLKHILFDKVRFPSFVNMKAVDEEGLSSVVPSVWWTSKDNSLQHGDKAAYDRSIDTIRQAVQEVESIQMSILKLLMQLEDGQTYEESSRALFLAKFRTFLKEHAPGSRVPVMQTPLPVILCLFQRLLSVFLELWNAQGGSSNIKITPHLFYDGQINYFDTHRLGGLESHLMKTLKEDRENALKLTEQQSKVLNKLDSVTASATGPSSVVDVDMFNSQPSTSGAVIGSPLVIDESIDSNVRCVNVTELGGGGAEKNLKGSDKDRNSLLYLLDGIILLYHIGAHKQLGKVAAQRDSMNDNINHIQEIDKKIQYCKDQNLNGGLLNELEGSRSVFLNKVVEQARQQAWVLAALHSQHKHHHLIQLINIILTTLQDASKEGELFAFVPDFYVESLTEMCTALRLYFSTSLESLPGYQSLLTSVGEFLALHFCDSRIVYADSKDSLIQALAGFVCHQTTLTALENMPQESRLQMVRNLLQPYENRAWAQNNWILVRFWKGCGFGFRYTKSPHMTNKFGPKPAHSDNPNFTQATAPCPSMVFQQHVVEVLEGPGNIATPFLNSLLNQLNWAFSEFIGMLQEIQNASNRPERVFIDSRQLRICATCFDLALALLRVLEMIVNIDPQLFINTARPDAELLLSRLCQLLCQVLNRVSGWSGCFGHVVSLEIPGLETIHHYPILTAVTGILVTLVKQDLQQSNPKNQVATRTLLNEPSFQLNSIYQLLGGQENSKTPDPHEILVPHGASGSEALAGSSSSTTTPIEESEAMLLATGAATETDLEASTVSLAPVSNSTTANDQGLAAAASAPNVNFTIKFSLRNYPGEVLSTELDQVEQIVSHLAACMESQAELSTTGQDDDTLCTICYAYPSIATFHPCAHSSCRACVTQHLMNRSDCFFCKSTIQRVTDQTSNTILYQAENTDKTSTTHK